MLTAPSTWWSCSVSATRTARDRIASSRLIPAVTSAMNPRRSSAERAGRSRAASTSKADCSSDTTHRLPKSNTGSIGSYAVPSRKPLVSEVCGYGRRLWMNGCAAASTVLPAAHARKGRPDHRALVQPAAGGKGISAVRAVAAGAVVVARFGTASAVVVADVVGGRVVGTATSGAVVVA